MGFTRTVRAAPAVGRGGRGLPGCSRICPGKGPAQADGCPARPSCKGLAIAPPPPAPDQGTALRITGHGREVMARLTGLEPATPGVTGRYSNRLSYNRASLARTDARSMVRLLSARAGGVKRLRIANRAKRHRGRKDQGQSPGPPQQDVVGDERFELPASSV